MPKSENNRAGRRGFSLVELLIVVVLLAVLAAVIIPTMDPAVSEQLSAAAQVVVADLDYARSLAITNNSSYRVDFDAAADEYVLTHVGSNSALDTLPPSPLGQPDDPPTEQRTRLADIPRLGPAIELSGVRTAGNSTVTTVTFDPLGGTVRSQATIIWLACGSGTARRYLPIQIDPVTGLSAAGSVQSSQP